MFLAIILVALGLTLIGVSCGYNAKYGKNSSQLTTLAIVLAFGGGFLMLVIGLTIIPTLHFEGG